MGRERFSWRERQGLSFLRAVVDPFFDCERKGGKSEVVRYDG